MSGFKVNFSVNNQLATPAIHAAALANRPAAGQPGRVFIDTDNPSTGIYRDTGTAWIQIAATSSPEADTLQTVTDRGNTTDNTLILTYDSLFNGSNAIEFFDTGTTATRYSITKQGTGNRLTLQGNSPLSTNDMGLMIDAPNNTLRTYWGSSFNTRGISCDFTNNIYRLGNISGTAGQQGIYINSSDNIGIGTITPTTKLDVVGRGRFGSMDETRAGIFVGNPGRVQISSTYGAGYNIFLDANYSYDPFVTMGYGNGTNPLTANPLGNFLEIGSENASFGWINNVNVNFKSAGSTRAMITRSTYNFLINSTVDAGFRFDCTGTARITSTATFGSFTGTAVGAVRVRVDGGGYGISIQGSTGTAVTQYNFGNIVLPDGSGNNSIFEAVPSSGLLRITSPLHQFRVGTTNAIYINGSADVGINTTGPAAKLHLVGTLRIDGQSSGTAGGSSGQHLIINLDGTQYKIALLNP